MSQFNDCVAAKVYTFKAKLNAMCCIVRTHTQRHPPPAKMPDRYVTYSSWMTRIYTFIRLYVLYVQITRVALRELRWLNQGCQVSHIGHES